MVKVSRVSLAISAALIASTIAAGGTVSAKGNGAEVSMLSATQQYKLVNVELDGKLLTFDQSAIIKDGSTLVPLRGVFEALKAEVAWNKTTRTVTAIKGETVVKLTVGESVAYVNGKAVTLASKAEIINNATLVPLRFVSEALGAKVSWQASTETVVITSASSSGGGSAGQVVNGIKVQYGQHTYGSQNQTEYDKVMKVVKEYADKYSTTEFDDGSRFSKQFELYITSGDRYTDYPQGTMYYMGLKVAEGRLGGLVEAGVSKAEIEKLHKTGIIAGNLMVSTGATDPGDGSPSSLYDLLYRGVADCDPDAFAYSAVYDALGYETMIVGGQGHADMFVKVGDSWYRPMGGTFTKSSISGALNSGGTVISAPTYGSSY